MIRSLVVRLLSSLCYTCMRPTQFCVCAGSYHR
jgi:hypothetical protein